MTLPPTSQIETPLGPMTAGVTPRGLAVLEFPGVRTARALDALREELVDDRVLLDRTRDHLRCVLHAKPHDRKTLPADLPLDLRGTDFELAVWNELLRIPRGQTRSYADIARALGKPNASRAVGIANGRNRIAIIVPCHRVIGADGRLTGYGGGLDRKRKLLELEGALAPDPMLFASSLFA